MTAIFSEVIADDSVDQRINALLAQMSIEEKIGQMRQANASHENPVHFLGDDIRTGRLGAILNLVDVDVVNELQRIAVEESRLGIPILVGRDVIHGFKTVLPIPLGQAATWNPELVERGARVAASEAASHGVNWTFAPMVDVTRDPRWGRIAESSGEDPFLTSAMAVAMVRGFQGDDLAAADTIAACAKHFAGYGAAESGRDYATTNIPENELRNVYLKPFKAAVDAGVATFMASFSDLNGVPATGNRFLMRQILRDEWGFDGFVVSDWDSVHQLSVHGLTEGDRESAYEAAMAGVDMEMAGKAYDHLQNLVADGHMSTDVIDGAVRNILRTKFLLGLFDDPYVDPDEFPEIGSEHALQVAKQAAVESIVLLRNESGVLPLQKDRIKSLAVIGPLADAPYEQLGTWIFDGDVSLSVTGLQGIQEYVGNDLEISYVRAMPTSRSRADVQFDAAFEAAQESDAVVLFLGEESILSGEAHSRADINLPGAQAELVREVRRAGKPVIAVILAGRPLTLANIVDQVDAILFAWHPGTMGGAAIADVLFGDESPSGKLPVTFPRMVGQIPIYFGQKNTGKPPSPETTVHIDDIDPFAPQTSFGMTAFHLDAGYRPLWEFGFGLSYASFEYREIATSVAEIRVGETISISAQLKNTGDVPAFETAQLYVRDVVGNVTRPVRELKGFRKVRLDPGQETRVEFRLHTDDLAFFGRDNTLIVEPGEFHAWIGGSSDADLRVVFHVVD
ncbi:MAG: glycoside hydrolase family 3 C-terminal domain-containing protein [Gammaproteobacteria bacterium]|nr:glycoside hydrolase family 3 C-terminal domain-containing protein [Gammaproteobacteria bacterium]MDH5302688.1 glycoside hydrolase family 3 C-terminal domain-containing protein [Gammaproteobacteria bacterium]MDH5320875.1 glycoside hydrolase family 3 C-terminal domain-containing protein [Gammaproteobacteria bacterium]